MSRGGTNANASEVGRRSLELKRDIAIKRIDECLQAAQQARDDGTRLSIFLSRFSKLESYCSSFETHHFKICSEITDETELDEQDKIRHNFDEKYFEILELHSLLTENMTSDSNTSEVTRTDLPVKLPRTNLLNYDGDIKNWSTFYDMYNTMTLRVQSAEGTTRVEVPESAATAQLYERVHEALGLASFAFVLHRDRARKDELVSSKSRSLRELGLQHGDMLYLSPVNGAMLFDQPTTSAEANNKPFGEPVQAQAQAGPSAAAGSGPAAGGAGRDQPPEDDVDLFLFS